MRVGALVTVLAVMTAACSSSEDSVPTSVSTTAPVVIQLPEGLDGFATVAASPDGEFLLEVPETGTWPDVEISVESIDAGSINDPLITEPESLVAFELGPDGASFDEPVIGSFEFSAAALGVGDTAMPYFIVGLGDPGSLEQLDPSRYWTVRDGDAISLHVEIDHFSTLVLLWQGTVVEIEFDDSYQAYTGESFDVVVVPKITGDVRVPPPLSLTAVGRGSITATGRGLAPYEEPFAISVVCVDPGPGLLGVDAAPPFGQLRSYAAAVTCLEHPSLEEVSSAIGLAPIGVDDAFFIFGSPTAIYDPVLDQITGHVDLDPASYPTIDGGVIGAVDQFVSAAVSSPERAYGAVIVARSPESGLVTVAFVRESRLRGQLEIIPLSTYPSWRDDDGQLSSGPPTILVQDDQVSVALATGDDPLQMEVTLSSWSIEDLFESPETTEPLVSVFEPKVPAFTLVEDDGDLTILYGKNQGSQQPDGEGGFEDSSLLVDDERFYSIPDEGWAAGTTWKVVDNQLVRENANGEITNYGFTPNAFAFDEDGLWATSPHFVDGEFRGQKLYRIDASDDSVVAETFDVSQFGQQIAGTSGFVYFAGTCLDRASGVEYGANWGGGYSIGGNQLFGILDGRPQLISGCPPPESSPPPGPAPDPEAFVGTWAATNPDDGSTVEVTIEARDDGSYEVMVTRSFAQGCLDETGVGGPVTITAVASFESSGLSYVGDVYCGDVLAFPNTPFDLTIDTGDTDDPSDDLLIGRFGSLGRGGGS